MITIWFVYIFSPPFTTHLDLQTNNIRKAPDEINAEMRGQTQKDIDNRVSPTN